MARHVDLVSTFLVVWGVLALVTGTAILVLGLGALAVVRSPARVALGPDVAADFTVAVFFVFAIGALTWGGLHLWTGAWLRRRRPLARHLAFALAVLDFFVLPLGTALAVYVFWVLLSDGARRLFEPGPAAPHPAPAASGR
jgi:hypothetical protein